MSPNENNSNNNSKDDAPKGKAKRRKRGGGGRNRERNQLGGGLLKGPPQTPQLKVTIRNIHNAEQNGTVKHVGERILRKLVQLASEKLSVPSSGMMDRITLLFDEAGFRALVEADEAARKAQEEWKQKLENEGKVTETKDVDDGENVADPMEVDINNINNKADDEEESHVVEGIEQLHISVNSNKINDSTVHVRILYVVPPKMTKRRGEKTGCAYLVLTAPPIPAREPPAPTPESLPIEDAASTRSSSQVSVQQSASTDYSHDMAKRRLMIHRTLEALVKTAEEDAKTKQELSECVVMEALNGKTWKARTDDVRRDRMEGTIEDSPDYKAFFEKSEQEKQERKSRPKPAPGGGVSSSLAISTNNSTNNGVDNKGQPIAALVLHLRKKQEEEKKRMQQAKSKGKPDENTNKGASVKSDAKKGAKKARGRTKKKTDSSATSKPSVGSG